MLWGLTLIALILAHPVLSIIAVIIISLIMILPDILEELL